MRYVVVSNSEIRAKAIYNLVRDYLPEAEGTYLIGQYDMDYLLYENLEFLFFDTGYYKEYRNKISRLKGIQVKKLILFALEEDLSEDYPNIQVINNQTCLLELEEKLEVKIKKTDKFNLTDRDKSILYLLSQGHSNKEIGKKLYLSEKTIKNNLTRIYKELGARNKYEAIKLISKIL